MLYTLRADLEGDIAMPELSQLGFLSQPLPLVIGGTVLSALLLIAIRLIIFNRLRNWTERSKFTVDSVLVSALSLPLSLITLALLLGIIKYLLEYTALISQGDLAWSKTAIVVLCLCALVLFCDRFVNGLIASYSRKTTSFKNSASIIQGVARGLIFCIGTLVLLGTLGISITPIVASLGITSLAVALALQPTLENFFSGVQLVVDKPIRVGDFIELESGEQGFVERIGWRSTWIKMLPNNTIIVPNSVLSKSKIVNYFYPEKELSVPVEVGVHYSSDLEFVEKVTLEVAKEILVSHKWGVDNYETFVVYHTFDSSSINFTVMLRAKEYFNRFWLKSAFIKALHKRFAEEGIVIPYPIRALNTEQEKAKF